MERFGEWLRRARITGGLSQAQLGASIGKTNVYISNIENPRPGRSDVLPDKRMLPLLAERLGVSLEEIAGRYGAQKAGVAVPAISAVPVEDQPGEHGFTYRQLTELSGGFAAYRGVIGPLDDDEILLLRDAMAKAYQVVLAKRAERNRMKRVSGEPE